MATATQPIASTAPKLGWFSSLPSATRRTITGYLFIMPFVLGFLFWFLAPALVAVWLTFTDWNLIRAPRYVGFDNILRLGTDNLFWQSLKVTILYTLASVPLGLVLALLLALLINTKVRGIAFFRTIYYLPSIVPAVASAVLWAWIFNTEFGLLNAILRYFGIARIPWLQDPDYALWALIMMSLWGLGGSMIIYLAGLQGIPDVYYEAAEIDGAGRLRQFWNITLPLLSPVIFFNLIMSIIGTFQVFTAGFLITNGGPQNATLFYVLYLYRNAFEYLSMGYAAALAWVLFLIILVLTLLIFRYVGGMVHYEDNA
ncbi:MAG: sugar ABC transporter permease [Chloroflexota bacterium]|nr:sugar ABC transporter permease [Chloroflexota bacterium]